MSIFSDVIQEIAQDNFDNATTKLAGLMNVPWHNAKLIVINVKKNFVITTRINQRNNRQRRNSNYGRSRTPFGNPAPIA